MLYIWNIEKIIKSTLDEHNLDINYEINNNLPAPMSYNVSTNSINDGICEEFSEVRTLCPSDGSTFWIAETR